MQPYLASYPIFTQPVYYVVPNPQPPLQMPPLQAAGFVPAAASALPPEPQVVALPLDSHTAASLIASTIYKQQKNKDPIIQAYLIRHILPLVTHLDLAGLVLTDKWIQEINDHCIALKAVFLFGSTYQGQPVDATFAKRFASTAVIHLEQLSLPQFMEFSGHVKRMLSNNSKLVVDKTAWASRFQDLFDLLKALPRMMRHAPPAPAASAATIATVTNGLATLTLTAAAALPPTPSIPVLIADYAYEATENHTAAKAIIKNLWTSLRKKTVHPDVVAHLETASSPAAALGPVADLAKIAPTNSYVENDPYVTILSYLAPSVEESTLTIDTDAIRAPGHQDLHAFLVAADQSGGLDHPLFQNPLYDRFLKIFQTRLRSIPNLEEVLTNTPAPGALKSKNAAERLFSELLAKTLTTNAVLELSLQRLEAKMSTAWDTHRERLVAAYPRLQRLRLPPFARFNANLSTFLTKFTDLRALDTNNCVHLDDSTMKRLKTLKLTSFVTNRLKVSPKGMRELDPSKMTHLSISVTPSTSHEQIRLMLQHFPRLQEQYINVVPDTPKPQAQSNPKAQNTKPAASAAAGVAIVLPGVPVYEKFDLSTILLKPESMALIIKSCVAQHPNTTHIILHPQQSLTEPLKQHLKAFTQLTVVTIGKQDYHLHIANLVS